MCIRDSDGAAALDEAAAGVHIGNVGELVVRDVQQPGQLRPVRRRLVEHDEELAVGQHGPGGVGLEQVVHILCDAGAAGPILTDTFPEGEQEVCAVLVLKQQDVYKRQGMYHDAPRRVTLLCENRTMRSVIDHFGEDVATEVVDAKHFRATVDVAPTPPFFSWVFTFGGAIRIEEPAEVLEKMRDMAAWLHT